jgi:Domain of unknown function (DUF5069)
MVEASAAVLEAATTASRADRVGKIDSPGSWRSASYSFGMSTYPKSPKETVNGMRYFARMLDKIRLHACGDLSKEYHKNLARPATADGACLNFLRVDYADLCQRVQEGGTDEEILEWCCQKGRRLNEGDLLVWNGFMAKFGWNDFATPNLERLKKECGIAERNDIITMSDAIDFDEKRKS